MNFGKLLAVGRSIVNGRAEVSYRADKQFYLPKFGPARNPFIKAPAEAAPLALPPKEKAPVAPKNLPAPAPRKAAPVAGPVTVWRPAKPVFKSVQDAQPELSLDTVKVVLNDLSDAEVEVVPLKSRTGAGDLPVTKKSWEILRERLMKATAM
ncbi:MAG: hypothetical protein ACLQSR_17885 [Limisphaerales bacterium]